MIAPGIRDSFLTATALGLLMGLPGLAARHLAAAEPQLVASLDDDGVSVLEGDSPVLSYQAKTRSLEGRWARADYVHPLYDLRGEVITEDFPEDHRHQRGIFWAWHQLWVGDNQLGDGWACQDFEWDVRSLEVSTPANPLCITAITHWKSPRFVDDRGDAIPVVKETARICVHAMQPHYRVIDFDLSLLALLQGVRIGGSEDEKGYGGFSPRIRMEGDEQFLSSAGVLEPETTAITAGTWVNITGSNHGLAMIVHRDNPCVSQDSASWILRQNGSMQNAVFPGRDPVSISTTDPLRLRYRVVVHDGSLSNARLDQLQADFWESAR